MSERYLWDRSGEEDRDVARLERLLSAYRYSRPAPAIPIAPGAGRPRLAAFLAAAATLLLAAGAFVLLRALERGAEWEVVSLSGSPTVNRQSIGETARLGTGEWLETDDASRARLAVADIGNVTIEGGTRLRLVATRPTEHRLELARGEIRASILAPPRLFFVDTPAATAVDLGCAYRLVVDDAGAGFLHVTFGRVAFERDGRDSIVPHGALCRTRPGVGPGTPWFQDATDALREALERLDFEGGGAADLAIVLREARVRDTLTLWHLLSRVEKDGRKAIVDRMGELSCLPSDVDLGRVLSLDEKELERLHSVLEDSWW